MINQKKRGGLPDFSPGIASSYRQEVRKSDRRGGRRQREEHESTGLLLKGKKTDLKRNVRQEKTYQHRSQNEERQQKGEEGKCSVCDGDAGLACKRIEEGNRVNGEERYHW